ESGRAAACGMASRGCDARAESPRRFVGANRYPPMSLYGIRQLAASARAVRTTPVLIAGDIPESQYDFRASPVTRSSAETLVHIAWLWTSDRHLHEELHLS